MPFTSIEAECFINQSRDKIMTKSTKKAVRNKSIDLVRCELSKLSKISNKEFSRKLTLGNPPASVIVKGKLEQDPLGRFIISELTIIGNSVSSDILRHIPIQSIEDEANWEVAKNLDALFLELPPLDRNNFDNPASFSEAVSVYIRAAALISSKPVLQICEMFDLPGPRVHAWVREARLRGDLPTTTRRKQWDTHRMK
jgi:hypothetical protein